MTVTHLPNVDAHEAYINRELSWLAFARRVLEMAEDESQPLLERVKFAGIMGMIFDEFIMKRLGGLHQKIRKAPEASGCDGHTPIQELDLCRAELQRQVKILGDLFEDVLRPLLGCEGIFLPAYESIENEDREFLQRHFEESVLPILTPLAVDAVHPFPFISNLSLNLAVVITKRDGRRRFVRLKVPANRKRWIALPEGRGFVRLEEVIANNLHLLFPLAASITTYGFRVTRGAKDNPWDRARLDLHDEELEPGSIIDMVTAELNYRKFAGIVHLEVSDAMPDELLCWLVEQLELMPSQVVKIRGMLGYGDLLDLKIDGRNELRDPPHVPIHHRRLKDIHPRDGEGYFQEISKGDILVHLPYHDFDSSILRLLQHGATDPKVLAIKLTIYRTSSQSPIIRALTEAAERGKQVAVLVEITARFDEAPNIAWGRQLERAGAHVVYGIERLKTHVKLAMIVREESDGIKRYVHIGTGNYHTGTARLYGDLGILSSHRELGEDVGRLFNELTGAIPFQEYRMLFVAPHNMRQRFTALIRAEAENRRAGKPAGIKAAGLRHHPGALPGEPGRRTDLPQCPRPVQPPGRCPGTVGNHPGLQHHRPLPRTQPDLPLRERGRAASVHRLGGLDEAQPRPAHGNHHAGCKSRDQGRVGGDPLGLRAGQHLLLGHAARRQLPAPQTRPRRGAALRPEPFRRPHPVARTAR